MLEKIFFKEAPQPPSIFFRPVPKGSCKQTKTFLVESPLRPVIRLSGQKFFLNIFFRPKIAGNGF